MSTPMTVLSPSLAMLSDLSQLAGALRDAPDHGPSQVVATGGGLPFTDGSGSAVAVAALADLPWGPISTLAAALLATLGVIVTLLVNASRARREKLAELYATSLGAVSEYLEGPYRILRKDGTAATRFAITSKLSDVKTVIDHQQALMRLDARPGVADAYDAYVNAAKGEAGKQMHDAWLAKRVRKDAQVNLNTPLPRGKSDAARANLVAVLQADLARRWWRPRAKRAYERAVITATT